MQFLSLNFLLITIAEAPFDIASLTNFVPNSCFLSIAKKISFIQNKKYLPALCFIIYAFGWNPQTIITGDVSSFPGYRIPYKSIQMLYYQIKNN